MYVLLLLLLLLLLLMLLLLLLSVAILRVHHIVIVLLLLLLLLLLLPAVKVIEQGRLIPLAFRLSLSHVPGAAATQISSGCGKTAIATRVRRQLQRDHRIPGTQEPLGAGAHACGLAFMDLTHFPISYMFRHGNYLFVG